VASRAASRPLPSWSACWRAAPKRCLPSAAASPRRSSGASSGASQPSRCTRRCEYDPATRSAASSSSAMSRGRPWQKISANGSTRGVFDSSSRAPRSDTPESSPPTPSPACDRSRRSHRRAREGVPDRPPLRAPDPRPYRVAWPSSSPGCTTSTPAPARESSSRRARSFPLTPPPGPRPAASTPSAPWPHRRASAPSPCPRRTDPRSLARARTRRPRPQSSPAPALNPETSARSLGGPAIPHGTQATLAGYRLSAPWAPHPRAPVKFRCRTIEAVAGLGYPVHTTMAFAFHVGPRLVTPSCGTARALERNSVPA
jgi:hypothetical protein